VQVLSAGLEGVSIHAPAVFFQRNTRVATRYFATGKMTQAAAAISLGPQIKLYLCNLDAQRGLATG
jgi:GDP-D-mannose dehydratase